MTVQGLGVGGVRVCTRGRLVVGGNVQYATAACNRILYEKSLNLKTISHGDFGHFRENNQRVPAFEAGTLWGYNPVQDERTSLCKVTPVILHGVVSSDTRHPSATHAKTQTVHPNPHALSPS